MANQQEASLRSHISKQGKQGKQGKPVIDGTQWTEVTYAWIIQSRIDRKALSSDT